MEVTCPKCGKRGQLDDARIPDQGIIAKCPGCQSRLKLHKVHGVSLAEAAPAAPQPPATPPQAQQPQPPQPPTSPPQASVPQEPPASPGQTAAAAAAAGAAGGLGFKDSAPPPPTAPSPPPEAPAEVPSLPCKVCGNRFPSTEMVRFGNSLVCAGCKPGYVQSMRSGVRPAGAMQYGGFWVRFVAKVIDGIILGVAQLLIMVPMMFLGYGSMVSGPTPEAMGTVASLSAGANLISLVMAAAYTTFFIGRFRATPGKMVFKLQVVMPDGDEVSYMRALGRHFAEWLSGIILLIGYIMAAFDSEKRTLHDRICSTRVVFK